MKVPVFMRVLLLLALLLPPSPQAQAALACTSSHAVPAHQQPEQRSVAHFAYVLKQGHHCAHDTGHPAAQQPAQHGGGHDDCCYAHCAACPHCLHGTMAFAAIDWASPSSAATLPSADNAAATGIKAPPQFRPPIDLLS